jgi:PAS domain S-box-containing protein
MGINNKKSLSTTAAELRHQAEELLCAKTAHLHSPRTNDEMQRLIHELEVHQIELEMQNAELRQAQEESELSRNKYTELYDFAPVGYFTFDASGVIREVNLTGAQLLGIERLLLANKHFSVFIADADGREIFINHLRTVLQKQGMQRCEIRLIAKDGTMIHSQLQSVKVDTIESKDGNILSSIVDGTIAKQLETEIRDAMKYAENIVETVREPLVVLSSDLKILSANHSFYDTFKVTHGKTIGNFIYDIGNRQWDIPKLQVLVEEILPHDTVINDYEVEHDFPGIGRKIFLLNARQILRKNIGSRVILMAMEDITARKQVEAEQAQLDQILQEKNTELESAKLAAEKANRAKSEFLSSMSHELRTPLGAILGFAQLMESGSPQPTPAQKRSIDQILKAGWYLLELINEILDLSLIESGKLSLSLEPVSLAEVMHECEVMVEPQAQKHGIGVLFTCLDTSYVVNADRTKVKQLLLNLLSNAIKYNTPDGKVTVTCALSPPDSIRISVCDTGDGLAREQLDQLFQPFKRLGQKASTEEGTGIGLVVCKRLVELMGGVIGVESTVGEGSVFWFELSRATEPQLANRTTELTAASGGGNSWHRAF